MFRGLALTLIGVGLGVGGFAQPVANFSTASSVCLEETLIFSNASTSATHYVWDFCHDDLEATPQVSEVLMLPDTGLFYHSLNIVHDGGQSIGFVTDISGKAMYRLEFGPDVTDVPSVVSVSDPGTVLGSPGPMAFVEEGGMWYLFVLNVFHSTLARLTFGNGLLADPTAGEDLGNLESFGPAMNTPVGIKAITNGTANLLFITNDGSNAITVVDFGNSFANAISGTNQLTDASMEEPGGIDIIHAGSDWYALVSCFKASGNSLLLSFGSNPQSTPDYTPIGVVPNGREVKMAKEGDHYEGFVRAEGDGVYHIALGTDFSSPTAPVKLATSLLQNTSRSLELVRDVPYWSAFTMEANSTEKKIYRLDFRGACPSEVSVDFSEDPEPTDVNYLVGGDHYIELTAYDDGDNNDTTSALISVTPSVSPAGSIGVTGNQCAGSPNTFQVNSGDNLVGFDWDFGDTGTSTASQPVHTYMSSNSFDVSVIITDDQNCHNLLTHSVAVYNAPMASFDLPSGLLCTNDELTFVNTTPDVYDGNLNYEWYVNESLVEDQRDLSYAFTDAADQDVKLITSIPGCVDEITQTVIGLQAGPLVEFAVTGLCVDADIDFENLTTGSVTSYLWDFGNGQQSTSVDASTTYDTIGYFTVSLEATSPGGCMNTRTTPVAIHSTPIPDFGLALPPFSCSGSPSSFTDETPGMADSNIISWYWDFGETTNSDTSDVRDPEYTYTDPGDYDVSLLVGTEFGCTAETTITVTIEPPPTVSFDHDPACQNLTTNFTASANPDVIKWMWNIDGVTYTGKSANHVFSQPGMYSGELIATGLNDCQTSQPLEVEVPLPVNPDFTYQMNCVGGPTRFTDNTDLPQDPVASYVWTFDEDETATGPVAEHSFLYQASFEVSLEVETEHGCFYTASKSIPVTKAPVASFSVAATTGGAPYTVGFVNTSKNAASYQWQFDSNGQETSVEASPEFIFTAPGEYPVSLVASNASGCWDSTGVVIHVVTPEPDLKIEGLFYTEQQDGAWTITADVINNGNIPVGGASVVLQLPAGSIREQIQDIIAVGASMEYTFDASVIPSSTLDYLCAEVFLPADVNPGDNRYCLAVDIPVLFHAYPNPVRGIFHIVWISSGEPVSVKMLSSDGKEMIDIDITGQGGLNDYTIDTTGFPSGIYLLKVNVGSREELSRIYVGQ